MKTEDILRYEAEQTNLKRQKLSSSGSPVDRPILRGYNPPAGRIAQLVRALLLHRRGRRFESCSAHRIRDRLKAVLLFILFTWF